MILVSLFALIAISSVDAKKGKAGKSGKGGKGSMKAKCENAEEGSKIATRCECWKLIKVEKNDRTDEQAAQIEACFPFKGCKKALKAVNDGEATRSVENCLILSRN